MKARIFGIVLVLMVIGAGAWGTKRFIRVASATAPQEVPVTNVK